MINIINNNLNHFIAMNMNSYVVIITPNFFFKLQIIGDAKAACQERKSTVLAPNLAMYHRNCTGLLPLITNIVSHVNILIFATEYWV